MCAQHISIFHWAEHTLKFLYVWWGWERAEWGMMKENEKLFFLFSLFFTVRKKSTTNGKNMKIYHLFIRLCDYNTQQQNQQSNNKKVTRWEAAGGCWLGAAVSWVHSSFRWQLICRMGYTTKNKHAIIQPDGDNTSSILFYYAANCRKSVFESRW